ncbi:tetratricopeptide repeat protein [Myxococcota bacterium]|nr:tetratricopeptide repeat protein [Myxococcota bacterium]
MTTEAEVAPPPAGADPAADARPAAGEDARLLDEAEALRAIGECRVAVPLLRRLLASFPDSPHTPPAMLALGQCLEGAGDAPGAREVYAALLSRGDAARQRDDAWFRLGATFLATGEWGAAERAFARASRSRGLTEEGRATARVNVAFAAAMGGKDRKAASLLMKSIQILDASPDLGDGMRAYTLAQARVAWGVLLAREAAGVRFDTRSEAAQRRRLQERAEGLRRAEDVLGSVASFRLATWSCAALHLLGGAYERFHADLSAAEAPRGLDEAGRRAFHAEVARRAAPLLRKALAHYQAARDLSVATGALGPWGAWAGERAALVEDLAASAPGGP